tara:strand:- start:330 stop:515 length:186 start_codon:yes stop_codon:yes gene_type:complete
MKLHPTVINEILRLFDIHGGHKGNKPVAKLIAELDLSLYNQNSTGKDVIVLTRELEANINR